MCKHITVLLRNVPGQASAAASKLRDEDINILAFHIAITGTRSGYMQLVCDDHPRAVAALSAKFAGYVFDSEVLVVRTEHTPGALSRILRVLHEHAINVENAYQTLDGRRNAIIVFEVSPDGLEQGKKILSEMTEVQVAETLSELQ